MKSRSQAQALLCLLGLSISPSQSLLRGEQRRLQDPSAVSAIPTLPPGQGGGIKIGPVTVTINYPPGSSPTPVPAVSETAAPPPTPATTTGPPPPSSPSTTTTTAPPPPPTTPEVASPTPPANVTSPLAETCGYNQKWDWAGHPDNIREYRPCTNHTICEGYRDPFDFSGFMPCCIIKDCLCGSSQIEFFTGVLHCGRFACTSDTECGPGLCLSGVCNFGNVDPNPPPPPGISPTNNLPANTAPPPRPTPTMMAPP